MKQIKSFFAITAFTLLFLNCATAAKTEDSIKSLPVELKYVGQTETQYLFALQFNGGEQNGEYTIQINDDDGYEFFKGNVKGLSFTKQFSVNADVFSESVIIFTITEKKSGETITYQANHQQKISAQMNIVKM